MYNYMITENRLYGLKQIEILEQGTKKNKILR